MKKTTPFVQLQILFYTLFLTFTIHAQVGIGTNTPNYQFEVENVGNIGATSLGQFTNTGINGVAGTGINFGTTNPYNAIEGGTFGNYSGVFGLGVSQDNGGSFDANGVYGHANDYQGYAVYGVRATTGGGPNNGFGGLFLNDLGYSGGFFVFSDLRTKKDIRAISNATTIIGQLNPVVYKFDTSSYPFLGLSKDLEFGFLAQELESVLPQLVQEKSLDLNAGQTKTFQSGLNTNKQLFKMVNYVEMIPLLTKGIQEQQKIIEAQNLKISDLEKRLERLENLIGDN